jgi:hypothetical protein
MSTLKTPNSIFTFDEIDAFCNQWGWIHVKEFVPPIGWLKPLKPPYFWSTYGHGEFIGVDGNRYMTHGTFRSTWIGDVKNNPQNKEEFKNYLKSIAGDYYGRKREHYYFYDVLLTGGEPYDAWWMTKRYLKPIPTKEDIEKYHGQPNWNVVICHMATTNGKMWEYKK